MERIFALQRAYSLLPQRPRAAARSAYHCAREREAAQPVRAGPAHHIYRRRMRSLFSAAVVGLLLTGTACAHGARTTGGREAAPAAPSLPSGVTTALIAEGDSLFNNGACVRCHGARGVGGENAPSLLAGPWLHVSGTVDEIATLVTTGVPRSALKDPSRRFAMNPRGGPMKLSDAQVRAVAAYVWSISRGKR